MQLRSHLPTDGGALPLYTSVGTQIARGFCRIVWGERGPYVEFEQHHLLLSRLVLNEHEKWRVTTAAAYYIDYRTMDGTNVKVYHQKKPVDYADYKVGLYYITPFDLYFQDGAERRRCAEWR